MKLDACYRITSPLGGQASTDATQAMRTPCPPLSGSVRQFERQAEIPPIPLAPPSSLIDSMSAWANGHRVFVLY